MSIFKSMLVKKKNLKEITTNSLQVLLSLYANDHENAVEELKKCRLNPDFNPKTKIRVDLEFYIPQIWFFKKIL